MGTARTIRLALAAILALSAVAAPGALGKYDSEKSSVELVGTQEGTHVLKTDFGNLVCQKAEITSPLWVGTAVGGGVYTGAHTPLHPTFTDCKMLGFTATVDTTGCRYTFTLPTQGGATGPHAQVDLVSDVGSSCKIIIEAVGGFCEVQIWTQTEMGLVDFMNMGTGKERDVTIDSTMKSIDYVGAKGFCTGGGTNGVYEGQFTLRGSSEGNQVGFWVTNT